MVNSHYLSSGQKAISFGQKYFTLIICHFGKFSFSKLFLNSARYTLVAISAPSNFTPIMSANHGHTSKRCASWTQLQSIVYLSDLCVLVGFDPYLRQGFLGILKA